MIGGHLSPASSIVGCVLVAAVGSVIAIARAGRPERGDPRITSSVRGPASYAGPGSLGGTESALGRR